MIRGQHVLGNWARKEGGCGCGGGCGARAFEDGRESWVVLFRKLHGATNGHGNDDVT